MIKLLRLDHVVLRTAQLERMVAFYREVLGCAEERRVDEFGLVQMRAGASLIDLVDVAGKIGRRGGAAPGREGRNMDHLCVRVAEFDPAAITQWLARHGVDAGEVVTRYGAEGNGPSLYIDDPDGNTIELKGPPG